MVLIKDLMWSHCQRYASRCILMGEHNISCHSGEHLSCRRSFDALIWKFLTLILIWIQQNVPTIKYCNPLSHHLAVPGLQCLSSLWLCGSLENVIQHLSWTWRRWLCGEFERRRAHQKPCCLEAVWVRAELTSVPAASQRGMDYVAAFTEQI